MKELIMEAVQPVILLVCTIGIGAVVAYIRKKLKTDKQREVLDQVHECLLEGMAVAQDQIVRPQKRKLGKLDDGSIRTAERLAVEHAKKVASGKAKKQLGSMSEYAIKSKIKQLLK